MASKLRIFYLIIGCLLFLNKNFTFANVKIRLAYSDAKAFPYQINHEVTPPGIAIEILQQVGQELNIDFVFLRLPNSRVQSSYMKDRLDGAFMYSFQEKRAVNWKYPTKNGKLDEKKRITYLSYYFYKLKESLLVWNGKTLSKLNTKQEDILIGVNMGYSISKEIKKLGLKVDESAKITKINFQKLMIGRIDSYAHQDLVADNYIDLNRLKSVVKLPIPIIKKPYFLIFTHKFIKEKKLLAQKIWDKIEEIRDPLIKKILHKYPL